MESWKPALTQLEEDLERIALHGAITPPLETWSKIETELNEITRRQNFTGLKITKAPSINGNGKKENTGEFVEVQGPSSHMRVHKLWRWVLAAIFVLGKIFLGFAIYYYLENRQVKQEIQELKQELKNSQKR